MSVQIYISTNSVGEFEKVISFHVRVSESYRVEDQWLCPAITLIITLNSIQSQMAYGLRGHLS